MQKYSEPKPLVRQAIFSESPAPGIHFADFGVAAGQTATARERFRTVHSF
jgi:hypothetical protein